MDTIWSKQQCLMFLQKFNAFAHKYLYNSNGATPDLRLLELVGHQIDCYNEILNSQNHDTAYHNLSRTQESDAAQGLKQIYYDENHYTNEYIEMLNLVRDKFIFDYTGITALCDFFSPDYFEYEWGMHLELNYGEHKSRYYRDHYVHQIRNLYEMFTLLDKFGYYEKCHEFYTDPENEIGNFISASVNQEMLTLIQHERELYAKILCLNNTAPGEASLDLTDYTERKTHMLHELMYRYVIYSATIIACVMHDIGYPIGYIRRIGGRINEYIPVSRLLTCVNADYDEIKETLKGSLLFRTVDTKKIIDRLKKDHGAQSAVLLLMYFYKHGDNLSILQKCALELGALVIYNHTNSYEIITEPDENNEKSKQSPELIRSDIYKEPLSHIFRMCDDLQEWDRVYFEVTDKSSIMICPDCHTPILRTFGTDTMLPQKKHRICCCKSIIGPSGDFDDVYTHQFPYKTNPFVTRSIVNVIGCDTVMVEDFTVGRSTDVKDNAMKFTMDFDLGRLLYTTVISRNYGFIRAKECKKIKRLCGYQGKRDSILIDAFVTCNPIAIKTNILLSFLRLRADIGISPDNARRSIDNYCSRNENYILSWLSRPSMVTPEYLDECIADLRLDENNVMSILNDLFNMDNDAPYTRFIAVNINYYYELYLLGIIMGNLYNVAVECGCFEHLELNTSNKKVLDTYKKEYDILCGMMREYAAKLINNSSPARLFSGDECLRELSIDYLMQQAHLRGYEQTKAAIEQPEASDAAHIRQTIIHRQFYENLCCCEETLVNYVGEYVSRERYERIKKLCAEHRMGSRKQYDRVDFYVDFGIMIDMWEVVSRRKRFFFSDDSTNVNVWLVDERDESDPNFIDIVLKCETQPAEFTDKYTFSIYHRTQAHCSQDQRFGMLYIKLSDTCDKYYLRRNDGSNIKELKRKAFKLLEAYGFFNHTGRGSDSLTPDRSLHERRYHL